jgi:hypothetical protein
MPSSLLAMPGNAVVARSGEARREVASQGGYPGVRRRGAEGEVQELKGARFAGVPV